MADTPILNYDYYHDNSDTPDFSDISIDENDPNNGLDGNEIRNIIEQIFPESLEDNAELVLTNDELKQQQEPKQQELQNQLQKLKKQLSEKEDKKEQKLKRKLYEKEQEHTQQIKYFQETLKEGKTEIMKEIGDRRVDRNENIDLNVQLKDFIDYCKKEITARNEFIEELNTLLMQKAEDIEFYRNNKIHHAIYYDQPHNLGNSIKGEMEKLKQENNDLKKEMNEKLNEKEKEIEEINVEKVKGSCEEEKVGEMIKTMTLKKKKEVCIYHKYINI
ncbi:hypothetical protein QTN25_004866 [Entamoeba marina]